jgi:hypothetical protein
MNLSGSGLGALQPGDHLCFPYDDEDEKRSTLLSFVREGLARGERCLFIGTPAEQTDLLAALDAAGVAAEAELARGALVVATHRETYLRTGLFDADDTLALIDGLIDRALADGFAGLRATGGTSSPVPDDVWAEVVRYEARVNELVARRPFVGLCRYHGAHVSPARVQDVLRTHPLALVRGEPCDNPFYERTELALGGDARTRVEWQLHQLRAHRRSRKRLEHAAASGQRLLANLASELADPLFALKREVHAMGAPFDETPLPERLEAATRHLRRLSEAVDKARQVAAASSLDGGTPPPGTRPRR